MTYLHSLQSVLRGQSESKHRPRVLDLFCGAGGLSLGFIAAGYEVAAGVEFDADAARTFGRNIPYFQGMECRVYGGPELGDINNIDPDQVFDEVGSCDVIIGGPPCKAFSRVGRGKLNSLSDEGFAEDPRNRLYERFREYLRVFRPKMFVMENVPGMLSVDGVNVAHRIARELSDFSGDDLGYNVRYAPLDAVWYGLPQFRQRLIYIGVRSDLTIEPSMPPRRIQADTPTGYVGWRQSGHQAELFGEVLRKDYSVPVPFADNLQAPTTVEDAFHDLPRITAHLAVERHINRPSRDWREVLSYRESLQPSYFARLMRDWDGPAPTRATGVTAHFIRMTRRDFETFKRMKPGDRYPDAHRIALERYEEQRRELEVQGQFESSELSRLKKDIVPPYPTDSGFKDRWQKLIPGEPSWTVTAHLGHDTYSHIHYDSEQARAISVREAARLQSFPDRFLFGPEGGLKSAYSQIGNAVPPLMGYAIARHVRELVDI